MRSCQAGWANCSCSLLTLMPFMARVLQLGARGDIAATAAAPLHTPARPRLVSLYSLPPHHPATPTPTPVPVPPFSPTQDPLALVTATWRCSRPRQGELLLSRPLLPHFSFNNVPLLIPCNPASKHRLCSHLLCNLVKLSAPLSPCNSDCLQYYYLCLILGGK